MAFIVEQLVGDRGIQLGYEEVIRPFSFGTNWAKIRVGILSGINGYTGLPAGTLPYMGVCTGNNAFLSSTVTDAVGVGASYAGCAITYAGTPPANYYALGGGTSTNTPVQRVNASSAGCSVGFGSTWAQISANPTNQRTAWMFTITKGTVGAAGVNFDMVVHIGGGTAGANDCNRSTFLAAMEAETSTYSPMTFVNQISSNLPTRFLKDWDSMFVTWVRSTPTMCIDCMTVVRFA